MIKNGDMPSHPVFDDKGELITKREIENANDFDQAIGMTKREEMATRIMAGFCAAGAEDDMYELAGRSVARADALLAALEKSK